MKKMTKLLPHPDVIATRKGLQGRPKPSLESVMRQARASEEWRRKRIGS